MTSSPDCSASSHLLARLPLSLLTSVLSPFLTTADLLAASSCSWDTRRLLLSPALWRHRVFRSFPPLPFPSASSLASGLPFWCDAVQEVSTDARSKRTFRHTEPALFPLCKLPLFPHLRHVRAVGEVFTLHSDREPAPPCPALASLAGMRQLTRLSLRSGGQLTVDDLRLLATLPALASFAVKQLRFPRGDERTLREWQTLTAQQMSSGGKKRKAAKDPTGEGEDGEEEAGEQPQRRQEGTVEEKTEGAEGDEEGEDAEGEEEACEWFRPMGQAAVHEEGDQQHHGAGPHQEDPNDPDLPLRHSALLLFLHHLAAKPSLLHLKLRACGLTTFIMQHMPVWPHLLCLSMKHNDWLRGYPFDHAAARFPSLTSLTSPTCSDAAIAQLLRLPALEELRFPSFLTADDSSQGEAATARGFRALSRATSLRSLQLAPVNGYHDDAPSLASLTCVFSIRSLSRLTVSAMWLTEQHCLQLLTEHHFAHLRCLELVEQYGRGYYVCPQTDAALLPLVKPTDVIALDRRERQIARASRRHKGHKEVGFSRVGGEAPVIPNGNAGNFPALECLALPYSAYHCGAGAGHVSEWMVAQLRRSYEYEVVEEWEAEVSTLGQAELLRRWRPSAGCVGAGLGDGVTRRT